MIVGQAHLVEIVLLHLVHGICYLLGFCLFIRLDLLNARGIPVKICIVWRGGGKGAFGSIVALTQGVFDGFHCVKNVLIGLW